MFTQANLRNQYMEEFDRSLQASIGKLTGGISPAAILLAFTDWIMHLLMHPEKQITLSNLFIEDLMMLQHEFFGQLSVNASSDFCKSSSHDKRFIDPRWQILPYAFYYKSFLTIQNWWHQAATNVKGVSAHHQDIVDFIIRQTLDIFSPSNSPLTNPEVQTATMQELGQNVIRGMHNYLDDLARIIRDEPPVGAENFVIGKNIAVTQGEVIYRNNLIELIQYAPQTDLVYAEPIIITPAWIMKYYILDLSPKHSLVNYLVKHGHTVFMISWKNPKKKDRNLGLEDYLNLGIRAAVDVVKAVVPNKKIHLVGYCLGGTLSAIAAAAMGRDDNDILASLTLLAAQTDFTEPGELNLFIDDSQIAFLENMMQEKGYLDTHQMAGAFQLLRSNDLIWSRIIHDYLLGQRKPLTDLMSWNADATRLPYRMHSEYLRKLFLNNELTEGKFLVDNKTIALGDIKVPIIAVATERDHVSPWRSVFKIVLLTNTDVTFILTSGGHNVGIVSLPVKKTKRHYRMSILKNGERYIDAKTWHEQAKVYRGSWWPAFEKKICQLSTEKVKPPTMGCPLKKIVPLVSAPGTYVFQK